MPHSDGSSLRKIIHVDMDAFFASVEQRDEPAYRGKPIVVGGTPEQRGAVAAASYEARKFGIHSALPARIARQRCPHVIFVKPRFEVYREVSQQVRAIFARYTELIEPLSLDEAYLDVTQNLVGERSAIAIAQAIRHEIRHETQLTASAGVSINKFLAKIASGMNKPDGLYVIRPEQAAAFVETLPVDKFHGIGQVTATKMHQLGIHTGVDLKQWPETDLVQKFGKVGRFYYRVARGEDHRPVNPNRIRKSIGAEKSFSPDLETRSQMTTALNNIAQRVGQRVQEQHRGGHTLTLKVKYSNYRQVTRSHTQPQPIRATDDIMTLGQALLHEHIDSQERIRLLGLALSNLEPLPSEVQYVQLALDLNLVQTY
ncbi:MAG: DNA polymerase IV [Leptolyngbya sp. SIOISBB]|nr:DNA polymerase IV [Leptolyngbya sp. SIOISBB]